MANAMSPNEAFQALLNDPERMAALGDAIVAERRERRASEEAFYNSPLCERMASDLIRLGHSLDSEQMAYFAAEQRAILGWGEEVRPEDIALFFAAFCREDLPLDKAPQEDEENPFDNHTLERRGLRVFFMSGQGSFTRIEPL